jgi:hypothetical protein
MTLTMNQAAGSVLSSLAYGNTKRTQGRPDATGSADVKETKTWS